MNLAAFRKPVTLILCPPAGRGDFHSPFPMEMVRVRIGLFAGYCLFERIVNNLG